MDEWWLFQIWGFRILAGIAQDNGARDWNLFGIWDLFIGNLSEKAEQFWDEFFGSIAADCHHPSQDLFVNPREPLLRHRFFTIAIWRGLFYS